jgi:uncharacterized BrkB/YihY/UPF0761 family membrane protein
VLANVVIAAGAATLSASGLLNSVAGEMAAFAITLTAGITLLFAWSPPRRRRWRRGVAAYFNWRRSTFPPSPCGSSSTNMTFVGHL